MKKLLMIVAGLLLVSRTHALEIDNDRAVLIKGEVEEYNMQYAIEELNKFAAESKKPVYLILNSPGGSVLDGFELVNTMEVLEQKGIKTICAIETMAYSMAAILAVYCQETYIHKFASIMHHEAAYGIRGSQSRINVRVKFTNDYLDALSTDIAKRLGMTPEDYRAKIHDEWWLTADQAVKAGLADGILNTITYTVKAPEPPKGFSIFFRNGQSVDHPLETDLTK